jgi:hypothetical protein
VGISRRNLERDREFPEKASAYCRLVCQRQAVHGLLLVVLPTTYRGGIVRESKLNRDWHRENKMPDKASLEQRLKWHLEHAKSCGCRPIPVKIAEELKKRETEVT